MTEQQQQQHYSIPFPKNEEEDLPLNLVALPPLQYDTNTTTNDTSNNHDMNNKVVDVLAYGGENGHIYLLPSYTYSHQQQDGGIFSNNSNDSTTTTSNNTANKGSDDMTHKKGGASSITTTNTKPILLYEYNDIVRSLSVSNDGLRIIVGFHYGDSKVFSFDDFVRGGVGEGGGEGSGGKVHVMDKLGRVHHPFVNIKKVNEAIDAVEGKDGDVNNAGDKSDEEEEEDGGFFTQSQGYDDDDEDNNSSTPSIKEFNGPRFDAAIRHMTFDPRSSSTSKQYYVAMVSESSATPLRVVNVYDEDTVEKQVYLEEEGCDYHMGSGVKSVAYSNSSVSGGNNKVWLTTLSMEGKINLWDVSSPLTLPDNWSHVHSDYVKVTPKDMGFSANAGDKACHLVWGSIGGGEKKKDVLLVPGKVDVQVRVIPSDGSDEDSLTCFKKQQFLMALEEGHKDNIVAMAFEPVANDHSSRRVVTAARDGKLLLWEMTLDDQDTNSVSGSLVKELTMVRGTSETKGIPVITSIVWVGDVLYVANADGEISVVSVNAQMLAVNVEEEDSGEKVGVESDVEDSLEGDDGLLSGGDVDEKVEESSKVKANSRVLEDDEDDEDGDINDAAVADSTGKDSGASKFIDDEAEAEDDDDVAASLNVEKDTAGQTAGGEDDDDKTEPIADDDVDFGNHDDPMDFGDSGDDHLRATSNYSLPPLQPAFAPSSTPIGDSRRILCWNHMGVLTLRPDVDNQGNNLVDISFHDNSSLAGGRRPITFTDNVGFIVGTLGDDGGLFASDLMEDDEDDDEFDEDGLTAGLSEATRKAVKRARKKLNGNDSAKGSSVYFHRFETFGKPSDKDWVYALPDGERVLGCATGKGWCGVMTSRRFLRLFTVGGIQGPIIWLPGEPVTVVGRGRFVAVLYHRSMSPMQDGTQLLGYSIIDGVKGTTVATGDVSALSPGASLTWVGFTDTCALTVMDSDGMLSLLARPNNESSSFGNWVPVLDTVGLKKSVNDNFWAVEVNGGKLVCVLLRGGKDHPDAARRPVTTTLKLRMPMATCLSMKSGAEEEASVRANIALDQKKLHDDIRVSDGMNAEDVDEEYDTMCRQVDKITLKLFITYISARKVERALDLANRFNTEKTYDIAINAADRLNLGRLCEKIEELKFQRFPPLDDDNFGDDESYNSGNDQRRSNSLDEDDEPKITSRRQLMEMQRISPDALHTPRKGRSPAAGQSTDEETPPTESLKRKFDDDVENKSSKSRVNPFAKKSRVNPFAKKRLESPAKGIMKLPMSPARPTLSKAKSSRR